MSYKWPMINAQRQARSAQYSAHRLQNELDYLRKINHTIEVLLIEFLNDKGDITKAKEVLGKGLLNSGVLTIKNKSEEEE